MLDPGDQLLLFTDGFIDAVNSEGDRFGDERFHELVDRTRALPKNAIVPELIKSIDDFAGGEPQFDDLTAVLIDAIARKPDRDRTTKGPQGDMEHLPAHRAEIG